MSGNHFVKIGLAALCIIALASLIEPFIFQVGGLDTPFLPPSALHLLGTDDLGHDVLREILKGGRTSIAVGLIVGLASAIFGILVGAVAGFFDYLDAPLIRLVDFACHPALAADDFSRPFSQTELLERGYNFERFRLDDDGAGSSPAG